MHEDLTPARLVALTGAAVLLGACSGPPEPPEGFTRIEQGYLAVHVPEGWIDQPDKRIGRYDLVMEDAEEDPTVQLVAVTDFGADSTGADARSGLGAVRDIDKPVANVDEPPGELVEVRSDDRGREVWRWDFTYDDGTYEGIAWAADDGERDDVVMIIVTGEDLDETIAQEIEDSVQVLDEPAEPGVGEA